MQPVSSICAVSCDWQFGRNRQAVAMTSIFQYVLCFHFSRLVDCRLPKCFPHSNTFSYCNDSVFSSAELPPNNDTANTMITYILDMWNVANKEQRYCCKFHRSNSKAFESCLCFHGSSSIITSLSSGTMQLYRGLHPNTRLCSSWAGKHKRALVDEPLGCVKCTSDVMP
jgi:hypothetical protein